MSRPVPVVSVEPVSTSRVVWLSKRLSVEMTFSTRGFTATFLPSRPTRFTEREERRYYRARNEMAAPVARAIGGPLGLVDHDARGRPSTLTTVHPDGRIETRSVDGIPGAVARRMTDDGR